jgi:hypothetical protein
MATQSQIIKTDSEKRTEDWMNSKWRPAMGWTYMATCIFDFVFIIYKTFINNLKTIIKIKYKKFLHTIKMNIILIIIIN